MRLLKTKLKDQLIIKQKNNIDNRGSLREIFNKKIFKKNLLNITIVKPINSQRFPKILVILMDGHEIHS